MPKKRHNPQYSKPPSTAPSYFASSSASSSTTNTEHHERSVNEILANMRRSNLNHSAPASNQPSVSNAPSVPPVIREILQIPETPPPPPRRLVRRDANGRRLPPGPPPPRSWLNLSASRHGPSAEEKRRQKVEEYPLRHFPLPGAHIPQARSLVDLALRKIVEDWEAQREWGRFYWYTLPSRLRTELIVYLSLYCEENVRISDLRLILQPPSDEELRTAGGEIEDDYDGSKRGNEWLNDDFYRLDLTGSLGKSIAIKELSELLFPPTPKAPSEAVLLESWDTEEPAPLPRMLLPNLTHLSLAVNPLEEAPVSWKALLSFAEKLPQLTHLSLAGWPEPAFVRNGKFSKMVGRHREVSYATGLYRELGDSDDGWSESVLVMKKLSKALYRLEFMDLTGCNDWYPALWKKCGHDAVDWVNDWGKITELRLESGYTLQAGSDWGGELRFHDMLHNSSRVETHVRTVRAGRGKILHVVKDEWPPSMLNTGRTL